MRGGADDSELKNRAGPGNRKHFLGPGELPAGVPKP